MGANNGKYYDALASASFFQNVEESFAIFADYVDAHRTSINNFSTSLGFKGEEAVLAKRFVGINEEVLVQDIEKIQKELVTLQGDIADLFSTTVDSAVNARIDYDSLEKINSDFQSFYLSFKNTADSSYNRATGIKAKFAKYGQITQPSFSDGHSNYKSLCGGDEVKTGYIYSCMEKLVRFDLNAQSIIKEKNLYNKIMSISDRERIFYDTSKENLNINLSFFSNVQFKALNVGEHQHLAYMPIEKNLKWIFQDQYNEDESIETNIASWWDIIAKELGEFSFGLVGVGFSNGKDNHYDRNKYNVVPTNIDEICTIRYDNFGQPIIEGENGWQKLPDELAIYHRMEFGEQGEEARYNYKFLYDHGDGTSSEVIICIPPADYKNNRPYIVTDPYNAGTFNIVSPASETLGESENKLDWLVKGAGHFFSDVLPYWVYGNAPEDSGSEMFIYRVAGPEKGEAIMKKIDDVSQMLEDAGQTLQNVVDDAIESAEETYDNTIDTIEKTLSMVDQLIKSGQAPVMLGPLWE